MSEHVGRQGQDGRSLGEDGEVGEFDTPRLLYGERST